MKTEFTREHIKPDKNVLHVRGDLTVQWSAMFKEKLIQLQEIGMGATAIDVSALQLLHAFKKVMESTGHSVSVVSPALPSLADLIIKSGWGNILYNTTDVPHPKVN